jgi:hypothetical protein
MRRAILTAVAVVLVVPGIGSAQDKAAKIANATSAAPESVSKYAKVMDWDNTVVREGNNGWTCFPDNPASPGNDPMCLDAAWMNWAHAWLTKTEPTYDQVGIAYMLAGGSPGSNTDPYAEGPTADNEWISEGGPHLMMLVPDPSTLSDMPTEPGNGGPWVMWRDTPYVHIMIPTPGHGMMPSHGM